MKQIFEKLRDDLDWYVDQTDHVALVIDGTDNEIPYVLKVLEQVEGTHDADMFLLFAHPCDDEQSYLSAIMASLQAQLEALNLSREEEGEQPWEPLPSTCSDPAAHPSDRIVAFLNYLRPKLPEGDHRVVFGLLPVRIGNAEAYARVLSGLLPWQGIQPWMANTRLVLRDDRMAPFLVPRLDEARLDRVLVYDQLDLSPGALIAGLEDAALSEETPEPERMMALVQIAALDFSYQRYDEAYKKWGGLFSYYHARENTPMAALCMCGAADVLKQVGRLPEAKEKYEKGLVLGIGPETLPVTLNLLLGIGEVCLRQHEWEEANGYLEQAELIAKKALQIVTLADILERRGIALRALGRPDEAQQLWRAAVDLSRENGHQERALSVLGHLIGLFDEARMHDQRRAHEDERLVVQRELSLRDEAHAQRFHGGAA